MKRNYKYSLSVFACSLLLAGCIEETVPQGSGSFITLDQLGQSARSYDNLVSGIVDQLAGTFTYRGRSAWWANDFGYSSFFLQRDLMGQDIVLESGDNWFSNWYQAEGMNTQTAATQFPWTCYYKWIKTCNEVLFIAGQEPDERHRYGAGVAHAMRAMFYLDMVQMFSQGTYGKAPEALSVVWIDETTTREQILANPRIKSKELYAHIISDLDKAEKYLANATTKSAFMPSINFAYGLKARTYLLLREWAKAEEYAKKAQNGYTPLTKEEFLSPNQGFNTANNSWILGIKFKENSANVQDNDGDCSWGSHMITEMWGSTCGYAANYSQPKRVDYHLYQSIPETDFRKMCFVDFAIDEPMNAFKKEYGESPKKDATDEEKKKWKEEYNKVIDEMIKKLKPYTGEDPEAALPASVLSDPKNLQEAQRDRAYGLIMTSQTTASKVVGGLNVKFRPKNGNNLQLKIANAMDVPLMRVEEMMLIEAEAAGMQDEARGKQLLEKFAKLRDPNYVYGQHSKENYGSDYATPFQNEVWWQRRVELWGEGFATFDIKRLDKGIIRSYANSNHLERFRWNFGKYQSNEKSFYPNWMDLVITGIESDYNPSLENNPNVVPPQGDSPEFTFEE